MGLQNLFFVLWKERMSGVVVNIPVDPNFPSWGVPVLVPAVGFEKAAIACNPLDAAMAGSCSLCAAMAGSFFFVFCIPPQAAILLW